MIVSKCGGMVVKGANSRDIVRRYEKLAYDAERAKDDILAQRYFNYAEHYKRQGQ